MRNYALPAMSGVSAVNRPSYNDSEIINPLFLYTQPVMVFDCRLYPTKKYYPDGTIYTITAISNNTNGFNYDLPDLFESFSATGDPIVIESFPVMHITDPLSFTEGYFKVQETVTYTDPSYFLQEVFTLPIATHPDTVNCVYCHEIGMRWRATVQYQSGLMNTDGSIGFDSNGFILDRGTPLNIGVSSEYIIYIIWKGTEQQPFLSDGASNGFYVNSLTEFHFNDGINDNKVELVDIYNSGEKQLVRIRLSSGSLYYKSTPVTTEQSFGTIALFANLTINYVSQLAEMNNTSTIYAIYVYPQGLTSGQQAEIEQYLCTRESITFTSDV